MVGRKGAGDLQGTSRFGRHRRLLAAALTAALAAPLVASALPSAAAIEVAPPAPAEPTVDSVDWTLSAPPVRAASQPAVTAPEPLAASEPPLASTAPPPFRVEPIVVVRLAAGQGPLDGSPATSPHYTAEHPDADGVPLAVQGGRLVYKPVALAQLGIRYLNGYRRSGDPAYLVLPEAIGRALVRLGHWSQGALYLPYEFDFAMHGNRADVIRSPWYSAMAQGLALALFTKLHEATGKPEHLATAVALNRSLRHIGRGTAPWVAYIASGRYLWLEEYAQRDPEHTINGAIFAAFGLYEYWSATGDEGTLQELRGILTTLKHELMLARNPGGPMDYCLKHGRAQVKYHHVVLSQLRSLTRLTPDPFFARAYRILGRDA